jgi:hypothetical protein
VRTYYDIEETDAYLGANELLVRRCGAWAASSISAPVCFMRAPLPDERVDDNRILAVQVKHADL